MNNIFLGKIEDGKIIWNSKEGLLSAIANHEGKPIRLEIVLRRRSLPQNRYYWMYLGLIEEQTGNNAEELHKIAKRLFLPPQFIKVMDKEYKVPGSTRDLTKTQFADFLDRICAWSGVPLPNPEDAGYINNQGTW